MSVTRRNFIRLIWGAAVCPLTARAKQTTPVIGMLNSGPPLPRRDQIDGFYRGLKEAGFVVGENVSVLQRGASDLGGLISYGPSAVGVFRLSARMVAQFLDGRKRGEVPTERPTTFELVVNLKTAAALGLTIPPSILIRADEVIE